MTTLSTTTPTIARTQDDLTDIGRLLLRCPDQPGIVAAVTEVLKDHGANIVSLDQYTTDPDGGRFFQRTVFHLNELRRQRLVLEAAFASLAARFHGSWQLTEAAQPKRVAILASTTDHCMLDLLWRQRRGDIPMTVPMVIANHAHLEADVRSFGIPFHFVPVIGGDKSAVEAQHLELLRGNVDLVVLARYMQIISADFLDQVGVPVINIHHSFLPAFIGSGPYAKAKARGVKLVGATAHYVTKDLDEGPIIEQDVVRVGHDETVTGLTRRGADVERQVLSRAVLWHCEDRVLRDGNSTVVF